MPVPLPRHRQVVSASLVLALVTLLGCSGGGGDPTTPGPSGASAAIGQTLMAESTARFVDDVTLDKVSILGQTYVYTGTAPRATRIFEVHPASGANITVSWSADKGTFGNGTPQEVGLKVQWTAPDKELTEARITMSVETPEGTFTRLYRMNVQTNPGLTPFVIPQAIAEVDLVDPAPLPDHAPSYLVAKDEMLVQVREYGDEADLREAFNALHMQVVYKSQYFPVYTIYNAHGGDLWAAIAKVKTLPFVEIAEPNPIHHIDAIVPNDPSYNQQYCLPLQHLEDAWEVSKGDANQIVAIMDTGTGRQHPDLMSKVVDGEDFIVPIGDGLGGDTLGDGVDNNGFSGADEGVGHGVHCSGISAALSDNGVGGAGMAWNTKLMGLRIFPIDGDNGASGSSIIEAHGFLAAHNNNAANTAKIVSCNMSFGGGGFSNTTQSAINAGVTSGCAYAGAAGNSNVNSLHYPSAYDSVIAVASTDDEDIKSGFSNFGTWVDVSACGSGIFNTYFHGPPGTPDPNIYGSLSGTSMASPQVAGLIALLKANAPTLTHQEVEDQIMLTADNIDDLNPGHRGLLGTGRINAFLALTQGLTPNLEATDDLLINDSELRFAHGNRDGRINPGEKVSVLPIVNNIGLRAVSSAEVEILNPVDPHLTIMAPRIIVESISRSGMTQEETFSIAVSPATPDGYTKSFNYRITDPAGNGGPWEFSFDLVVEKDDPLADTVNGTPTDLTGGFAFRPATNKPFFSVELPGDANYLTIRRMTVSLTGDVDPANVANVRLWLDDGDDEFRGAPLDTELALRSYWNPSFQNNFDRHGDPAAGLGGPQDRDIYGGADITSGRVTFSDIQLPILASEQPKIFVTADLLEGANAGQTVGLQVTSAADVQISSGDTLTGFPWGSDSVPILPSWGSEAQFTFGGGSNSWRAKAALDGEGNVFVFYDDNRFGDFDILMRQSTDFGRTWGAETNIVSDGNQDFYPDVAIGPGDDVYITWYTTRHGNSNREIYFKKSTDNGGSWGPDTRVTNQNGHGRVPRVLFANNTIHIVWFDNFPGGGANYDVYYTNSTDGGGVWAPNEIVSVTPDGQVAEEPQIAAAGTSLYCAWFQYEGSFGNPGNNHRVAYNFKPAAGAWGTPRLITDAAEEIAYGVKVSPSSDGKLYATYHSDKSGDFDIWMQILNGATTEETIQVTADFGDSEFPSIVRSPDGRIDIAYQVAVDGSTPNIFHITRPDDASPWSEPVRLSNNFNGDGASSDTPYLLRDTATGDMWAWWHDTRPSGIHTWFNRLFNN